MKTYTKKILFGASLSIALGFVNLVLIQQPNAKDMWYVMVFILAMKAGIVLWVILVVKEHKKLKEENFRRKQK